MKLSFRTALFWSALSGFLALAWEIVWARVFNFASGSIAPVFGFLLAAYLLGLAAGSLASRWWHRDEKHGEEKGSRLALARLVLIANGCAFLVAPLTALLARHGLYSAGLVLVGLSGLIMGVVFPLLCHLAVASDEQSGGRLSRVYVANIVGSGAGSLLTGFVFMEWMGLHVLSLMLLGVGWLWAESIGAFRLPLWLRGAVILLILLTLWPFLSLYERLQYKKDFNGTMRFSQIVESRHGVITVDSSRAVYGNGAYDGVIDTQLAPNSWLVRPYFFSAVRDKIENVLVIGVSAGAWTQILAHHPQVKKVTAIELSHGYLELIAKYPEVKSVLTNPKVEVIIDDGRRWLRRNPERKFDAIVMNTAIHWREFASALLSKEYLELVKSHLTPDGVAYWNCTESGRAAKTGMEVFPHTLMVISFCMASNQPLIPDRERWRRVLSDYRIDGKPVLADATALEGVLNMVDKEGIPEPDKGVPGKWKWTSREHMQERWGKEAVITDDNLGHEYQTWGL